MEDQSRANRWARRIGTAIGESIGVILMLVVLLYVREKHGFEIMVATGIAAAIVFKR